MRLQAARRPTVLLLLLLLATALAAASSGYAGTTVTPVADSPYIEFVSTRYAAQGYTPAAPQWGALPFSTVYQTEAGVFGGQLGAFFLTNLGVYWGSVSAGTVVPIRPLKLGWAVSGFGCRMLVTDQSLTSVATPTGIVTVKCNPGAYQCDTVASVPFNFGFVNDTAVDSAGNVWVAASTGLFRVQQFTVQTVTSEPMFAVAHDDTSDLVVAGNGDKIYFFNNADIVASRWEWVTFVPQGQGGPIDDVITSLTFDDAGVLYIGTTTCLNIRYVNGTITRVDGMSGLPYNNILDVDYNNNDQSLWIATLKGAARWDLSTNTWRYFYLARYHPGTAVVSISTLANTTVLATDGGLGVITAQIWTLAQKAAWMDQLLDRHIRAPGIVGDCSLSTFGDPTTCVNGANSNSGLWSSLVAGAEAFRWQVTQEAAALNKASTVFYGMRFLVQVTGIKGLMARTCLPADQQPSGNDWHNSTSEHGWVWLGDTSSDEVTGHMFAYPIINHVFASNATLAHDSMQVMSDIMTYIVQNNFTLIDVTGKPTTWGHWNPDIINVLRDWCDERGVNSNQILAWLSAAYEATGDELFATAYANLTNSVNQYDQNLVRPPQVVGHVKVRSPDWQQINLKIATPIDDNYSDDELTYLPYFTYANAKVNFDKSTLWTSLQRTQSFITPEKSDLWNAMYMAMTGNMDDQLIADMIWNLQTWPLELIDWPVQNSHRLDVFLDPRSNRDFQTNAELLRVLPANERPQFRWNSDPYDPDGGSGHNECDPGAWLLPYWMARAFNILA